MPNTTKGWMPGAIHKPDANGTEKRYRPEMNKPFDLLAVVEHIAEGGENTWQWLFNETEDGGGPVSSTFFVAEDGDIYQGMSIYDRAWANGLSWNGRWYTDPQKARVEPTWWRIADGGTHRGQDPNKLTLSIEHAGFHNKPRTTAQWKSSVAVLHFIQQETGLFYIEHDTLIGHYEISPKNRANCPGPYFDLAQLAANGNSAGDPLKARKVPGVGGDKFCGTGFYDLYQLLASHPSTHPGLAREDEVKVQDKGKEECTKQAYERCCFKFKPSQKDNPVHLALTAEAIELKWV